MVIAKGLLQRFLLMNVLLGENRVKRCAMRKPRGMSFKRFAEQLIEINTFLSIFPVSETIKKIPPEN